MTSAHHVSTTSFRIADLFAGPGGLDMAAEILGIPSVGIEWDAGACETRRAAGLRTLQGDVRSYGPSSPELCDLLGGSPNVLAGGPPCQTFTVAGSGVGRRALDQVLRFVERMREREDWQSVKQDLDQLSDERTALVLEPLHWILQAIDDPALDAFEAVVLEQVPAASPVWEAYATILEKEGYATDVGVLHTEEFGVPQTRRRAVLIARRPATGGNPPPVTHALPRPTHQRYRKGVAPSSGLDGTEPWVSMARALPHRRGRFTVVSNYGTGGDPKARGRRESTDPSATVTGKNSRNRVLLADDGEGGRFTPRESGMLQTFPSAYPWCGKDVSQQIGNAVPPLLGMHVLSAVLGLPTPGENELGRLRRWTPS